MILLADSIPFIIALFEYEFLLYALIAGLIMGFITPLIGSFVIIRRLSFIADTLSHFSLAGLSIGLFLGIIIGSVIFHKIENNWESSLIFTFPKQPELIH